MSRMARSWSLALLARSFTSRSTPCIIRTSIFPSLWSVRSPGHSLCPGYSHCTGWAGPYLFWPSRSWCRNHADRYMCSVDNSLSALPPLFLGETPPTAPLGCLWAFGVGTDRWDNYRDVLNYIGKETSPQTLVANVLNRFPYESLNGPTGRLSPFLAESGICWMSHVDIDLDPEFAESLIAATDSVVVWSPSEMQGGTTSEARTGDRGDPAVLRAGSAVRSDRGVEAQGTRRDAQSLIRNEDQRPRTCIRRVDQRRYSVPLKCWSNGRT